MEVIVTDKVMGDMSFSGDMGFVEGMEYMDGMMEETQEAPLADRLMDSWIFVGGVTAAVLVIGVLLGFLSAKRKIKKGIDLYED